MTLLTSLLLFLFLSVPFSPSFLLSFSRRRASRSVMRDSMEILIHLRSRVKRILLHAVYIMHDYSGSYACIELCISRVFFVQEKDPGRICRYYSLMSCEIVVLTCSKLRFSLYHMIKILKFYGIHILILFNIKIWYYFNWETESLHSFA